MKKVITLLAVLTILAVQLCSCYYPAPETNEKDDTETDTVPDDTELKEPTEKFIIIPDISGLDEETAKNLLARKGLIPRIERAYNDFVAENRVVSTYPEIGSSVKEDDVITVTMSKGPRYFEFENAVAWFYRQGLVPGAGTLPCITSNHAARGQQCLLSGYTERPDYSAMEFEDSEDYRESQ